MLQVQILSPEKKLFEGEVQSIKLPSEKGEFQALHLHADIISTLTQGEIKLEIFGQPLVKIPIQSGAVEIVKDKIIVLVEA